MYILRNKFLNTASFLLAPPDEGGADDRSDAQKERDAINISDSVSNVKDVTPEANDGDDDEGDNEDDEDDNEGDDDNENGAEDNEDDDEDEDKDKEKDKNKEETDEEKTARLAQEKIDRKEARVQKRINKAVAAQRAAEARADAAEAKLKETPVEGLTEEEVNRRAAEIADTKLKQKQIDDAQEEFNKNCENLEAGATKIDANFGRKVNELVEELGPIPSTIINTLVDLDHKNGSDVLNYLTDNVDEAEELYDLRNNERRLAIKLTRISDKLQEAKKPKRKERSNLPPPISPINDSNRRESNTITGKESMEEFARKRAKQDEEYRKSKGRF